MVTEIDRVSIPEKYRDLLRPETRAFAYLATAMADGSPQVTPVWFDVHDGLIWINTAEGRTKWRNMRRRPKVALAIADPSDPYRYLQVRGTIVEWTNEGGRAHIDRLAKKYLGRDVFDGPPTETRVIFKIRPDSISGMR